MKNQVLAEISVLIKYNRIKNIYKKENTNTKTMNKYENKIFFKLSITIVSSPTLNFYIYAHIYVFIFFRECTYIFMYIYRY